MVLSTEVEEVEEVLGVATLIASDIRVGVGWGLTVVVVVGLGLNVVVGVGLGFAVVVAAGLGAE